MSKKEAKAEPKTKQTKEAKKEVAKSTIGEEPFVANEYKGASVATRPFLPRAHARDQPELAKLKL